MHAVLMVDGKAVVELWRVRAVRLKEVFWRREDVMYEPIVPDAPTMAMEWMWLGEGHILVHGDVMCVRSRN